MVNDPLEQALSDAFPNCAHCLQPLELLGEPDDLYWACPCGLTTT